jgi:hypothetical protein
MTGQVRSGYRRPRAYARARVAVIVLATTVSAGAVLVSSALPAAAATFDQTAQFISAPAPADAIKCPSPTTCYVVSETGGQFQPDEPAGVLTPLTIASDGTITSGASAPPGRPSALPTSPYVHHNKLFGVDCVSANVCYTVGTSWIPNTNDTTSGPYFQLGSVNPYVRDQSGVLTGWDIHWVDGSLAFNDIACPSPTLCFAVGTNGSNALTMAVHVNGNDSSPGDVNVVAGADNLFGIKCPTTTTCYAVGDNGGYDRVGAYVALSTAAMNRSNGAPIATVQNLGGTAVLDSIDCPTTSACYAAGRNATNGVLADFATIGSVITATSTQVIAGASHFNGVACSNPSTCYAVGAGPGGAVVVQYDLLSPTLQGVLAISDLSSIDCVGDNCYAVGTNAFTGQSVVVTVTPHATDVALHDVALSSSPPCTLGSGPEKAVDGAASNIYTDKWCVPSGTPTLTIQLPASAYGFTVNKIVVKHAGVAETPLWNTRAFRLIVRKSGILAGLPGLCSPTTVATVTNNTASVTTNTINSSNVSQVQLAIDVPTQNGNPATRIYEVEVWGYPSTAAGPVCL